MQVRALDRYVKSAITCPPSRDPPREQVAGLMPKDMITPFVAMIGLPFLALVLDYLFRWASILETMKRAGPEFCVMGLGSMGAIFVDKRTIDAMTALTALPVQLNLILVA